MRRREPWYLFCGDTAFARDCLLDELKGASDPAEQASLLQLLGQLGAFGPVAAQLKQRPQLLERPDGRSALLRLRQEQQHPNPWLALLPEPQQLNFANFCQSVVAGQGPLEVRLGGGLGDQLEALALMQPLHQEGPLAARLSLALPSSSRPALEPLLAQPWPQRPLSPLRWLEAQELNKPQPAPWLGLLPMRALMATHHLEPAPAVLLGHLRQPPQRLLLVCWRSKVDRRERLWAHLRSLPFSGILDLYRWLLPWASAQQLQVMDITRYTDAEERQLTALSASSVLDLHHQQLGSLADTAQLAATAMAVVSVDTALIHLAHALDTPRWLLLHRHPDARWRQRLQQDGGSYRESLRVLQQIHQDQWQAPLQQLRHGLAQLMNHQEL